MPRQPRESSGTGIYHVMMRGINHQNVFEDKEDYYQFLTTLDVMAVDVEYESTSNAYYDSEDKKWYGTESDRITIRKSANCYVDLKFDEQLGLGIEEFDVDDVLREI